MRRRLLLVTAALLTLLGSPAVYSQPSKKFPLEKGTSTNDKPAIGAYVRPVGANSTASCTATFIGKRLAITAAHCVDNSTGAGLGRVTFKDAKGNVIANRDVVATWRNRRDGNAGEDDFALLVLEKDICKDKIDPIKIGSKLPSAGAEIRVYGYGCLKRPATCPLDPNEKLLGGGDKTYVDGKLGATKILCPGDSGGPVISNGLIVAVNSGYSCVTKADIFARTTIGDRNEILSINIEDLNKKYTCKTASQCPDGEKWCDCTKSCGKDGAWCSKQESLGNCVAEPQ